MYKILLISIISLVFTSCTNKNSAFRYFQKENIQAEAIQNSKKTDIVVENETKVIFWATYLNKIEKYDDFKKELFLVSLYFANNENQDINEKNYKLTLNDNSEVEFEKIDSTNKEFLPLMLKNNWGNYYLVKFDEIKDTYDLKLKLSNGVNWAQLAFEK